VTRKRWVRAGQPVLLLVGAAVSIVLVYLAVRSLDVDTFEDTVRDSSPIWFVPALAALAVSVVVRVVRWRYLFEPAVRPPARAATNALLAGEFFNSIVPLRGGDVARVVVLHRDTGTSRVETGATVLAERLLDTIVLLLLVFASLPFAPEVTWLRTALFVFAGAAGALLIAVVVLRFLDSRRFAAGRAASVAVRALAGVRALRSLRAGSLALALTVVTWLAVAAACWFVLQAVHLELGYEAGILVAAATTFALVIPSAAASVGVFEAAVLVALRPYGVPESPALAYAVVLHVVTFAPFILAGLFVLGPSWRTLGPAARPAAVRSDAAASRIKP
jgi:uncharacterized membrane protein YbhN (UPF0104 family)